MGTLLFRILLIVLMVSGLHVSSNGQQKKDKEDEEINYVWIDTIITIDDTEIRLVSNDIIQISCCMKSPKYSRVSAKAAKWIRKTYDENYEGIPFKTLQNRDLAVTVIEAAKEKAASSEDVKMTDYEYKCD